MSIDEFSRYDVSRRQMLRLSALLTASGALPLLKAYEARAEDADVPLRIGYLPITDATPLLVAHGKGFFEEAGIKAEKPVRLRSWAQVLEAFISGQVNAVHLLSPMTVWARFASKAPAKVVAWNHTSGSGLSVLPHINSVKDLGGTTVAIPFWYSIHNVVLQVLLHENGLKPVSKRTGTPAANEVNLVVMAPADMVPALASKQISGYIVAEPFNGRARRLVLERSCASPEMSGRITPAAWCSCTNAISSSARNGCSAQSTRWSKRSSGRVNIAPRRRRCFQGQSKPIHPA